MINKTKKQKASILVVTMMILGIVLVTALSISVVSIQERKASMGSNKSNQAYQVADTGIEKVMQLIKDNPFDNTIKNIDTDGTCDGIFNSTVGYTVQLKDTADENITTCAVSVSAIASIKSIGTNSGQQRAIEAAVAASNQIQKQCQFWSSDVSDKYNTFITFPPNGSIANCKAAADDSYGSSSGSKLYKVCCISDAGLLSCGDQGDPYDKLVSAPTPNDCGW